MNDIKAKIPDKSGSPVYENEHGNAMPVRQSERFAILDILRGFALLGIAVANFSEFSLYSFLSDNTRAAMPTAGVDWLVYYLEYIFINGKFYTLFSLLFGIGFSIILRNVERRGANGLRIFYRRMAILLVIGFIHLMFVWSGDILMFYALLGMLLPIFRKWNDRRLLTCAAVLLVLPVVIDFLLEFAGFAPSAPVLRLQQYYCGKYGINSDNFAYWLRDADSYGEMFMFLVQGAFVRVQELVDGNRYFKVLGLFIIGFVIGRNRFYASLAQHGARLKRVAIYGLVAGLPLSLLYAYSTMNGKPWGMGVHSLLYLISVYPLSFAYAAIICQCFLHKPERRVFTLLAAPGRMALTNYISQSLWGVFLFYGIGLGFGASVGLVCVVAIAVGVFAVETAFSYLWLRFFNFGPLEWAWRILTYGRMFKLIKY